MSNLAWLIDDALAALVQHPLLWLALVAVQVFEAFTRPPIWWLPGALLVAGFAAVMAVPR